MLGCGHCFEVLRRSSLRPYVWPACEGVAPRFAPFRDAPSPNCRVAASVFCETLVPRNSVLISLWDGSCLVRFSSFPGRGYIQANNGSFFSAFVFRCSGVVPQPVLGIRISCKEKLPTDLLPKTWNGSQRFRRNEHAELRLEKSCSISLARSMVPMIDGWPREAPRSAMPPENSRGGSDWH